jgi:hypothetical protein
MIAMSILNVTRYGSHVRRKYNCHYSSYMYAGVLIPVTIVREAKPS